MGCNQKLSPTIKVKEVVCYDTIVKEKFDTIREIKNDTVYFTINKVIVKEVIKTIKKDSIVYEKCNDRTERIKTRLDYKAERDSLETLLKLEREKTKQQKHTGQQALREKRIENRSNWLFWLMCGGVLGTIFGYQARKHIFSTL